MTNSRSTAGMIFSFGSRRAHWNNCRAMAVMSAALPSPAGTVLLPAGEGSAADITAMARQLFQWARRDPKLKIIPAVERELVIQALKETDGNQLHAAKLLGITRATLRKRVEKFGICLLY